MRDSIHMALIKKKVPHCIVWIVILYQTFFIAQHLRNIHGFLLDENQKKSEFSKMFMFLPSTLDRKEKFLQWQDHVHLHPVDVSYDELKEYNDDTDFNPADLNNKELRKNLTKLFYKYMKRVAEISNHNIVRNSDAYMAGGGQIDPDNEFSWIDNSYKEGKEKFQLSY